MFCPKCKQEIADNAKFCKHCGADVQQPVQTIPTPPVPPMPSIPTPPIPTPPVPTPMAVPVPTPAVPQKFTEDMLPEQYRPLSGWAYFGLSLLFSIPIVGFVFLIVFSFSRGNINRRNYARSYWCALLVAVALVVVVAVVALALGASLESLFDY